MRVTQEMIRNLVPIVTPFTDKTLSLDYDSFVNYLNFLRQNGIKSVIVGGTTGESISLTNAERKNMCEIVRKEFPEMTLFGGILVADWLNLHEIISAFESCDGLLVMPQMFIRPTDQDVAVFFKHILANTDKQILLYNNPARLGTDIKHIYREFVGNSQVIGVKETVFDLHDPATLPEISWWCGEDSFAIDSLKHGASGMVSALANVLPDISEKIVSGECTDEDVKKWHDICNAAQKYRNPMGVKYLLYRRGIIKSPALRFALQLHDIEKLDSISFT